MTRCCTVVYAVLNLAGVWAEGIPSRLCLHHISTYLRICLRRGDAAHTHTHTHTAVPAVCGCPMLAPRSEPASPALVAACHGDPSSAVVAATECVSGRPRPHCGPRTAGACELQRGFRKGARIVFALSQPGRSLFVHGARWRAGRAGASVSVSGACGIEHSAHGRAP